MQCILVKSDEFENSNSLLYILFKSCLLAYLKDSNAAAHSVDSDIFQSSFIYLRVARLNINLYFLKHCRIVGNLSLYASTSCMMTHRWRVVTRDRDEKSHYNLNYDSHQPLFYQIAKIERCVEYASIATCEYALITHSVHNDIFYGVIYLQLRNDALMARCEKQL